MSRMELLEEIFRGECVQFDGELFERLTLWRKFSPNLSARFKGYISKGDNNCGLPILACMKEVYIDLGMGSCNRNLASWIRMVS